MTRMLQSGPIARVIAGGCAAAVLVVLIAAQSIWSMRAREIEADQRYLSAHATVLAEQTSRTIQSVELVLDAVVHDASEWKPPLNEASHQALAARVVGLPQLEAIGLFDAAGTLVASSRWYPPPPLNIGDEPFFKALQGEGAPHIVIGPPVRSSGTKALALPVMHGGTGGGHGGGGGIAAGLIPASYFEQIYAATRPGPGMAISLWTLDGKLIAHYPPMHGAAPVVQHLEELAPGEGQDIVEEGYLMSGARMKAIRRLHTRPIVVVVSKSMEEVLSDWREDSASILAVAAGGLAAIAFAMVALIRQFRAYEARAQAQAAEASAIRAREEAEATLAEARRLETVGRLTTGVAHDFNNLLMTISGSLDLLSRQKDGPENASRLMGMMRQAVDRGGQLTHQLLAYARKQRLEEEALDVNALLRATQSLLVGTAGPACPILLDCAARLPKVIADGGQIQDALINLVLNARDAMPGGGDIRISTRLAAFGPGALGHGRMPDDPPPGPFVEIAIADQGVGMTSETLSRAMEPFFTTRPPGRGSGLGLSQVQGTIRQSGGAIRIESASGLGTVVKIYLPVARTPVAGTMDAGTPGTGPLGTGPLGSGPLGDCAEQAPPSATPERRNREYQPGTLVPAGCRVLVVEDEEPVRLMLAEMLVKAGYDVELASDGIAGLAKARKTMPDIILADLAMPGMDGVEMAARLRAGEAGPCPPIVFMTGYPDAR